MSTLNTSMILLGIVLLAALLPMSHLQSAETSGFERDYGSCLINAGLSRSSLHPSAVEAHCGQRFASKNQQMAWQSVSHCYDAYNMSGMSQGASLMIYRGCASYF